MREAFICARTCATMRMQCCVRAHVPQCMCARVPQCLCARVPQHVCARVPQHVCARVPQHAYNVAHARACAHMCTHTRSTWHTLVHAHACARMVCGRKRAILLYTFGTIIYPDPYAIPRVIPGLGGQCWCSAEFATYDVIRRLRVRGPWVPCMSMYARAVYEHMHTRME